MKALLIAVVFVVLIVPQLVSGKIYWRSGKILTTRAGQSTLFWLIVVAELVPLVLAEILVSLL